MSLRTRLTLVGGGAVFVALAIASLILYFAVRSKLHEQIDASLITSAQDVSSKVYATLQQGGVSPPFMTNTSTGYMQVIPSLAALSPAPHPPKGKGKGDGIKGGQLPSNVNYFVPLTGLDTLVAHGDAPPYLRTVTFKGAPMRLYTQRLATSPDGLVRTARPLTEANATISRVRWVLLALTLGGAFVAALLGRLAAATVLRPVGQLAGAVQEVADTRDLSRRIAVTTHDELGSLAENFNTMLAALDESQRTQQQLIADASHELRTPLTAHRANIELLARSDLPPERRPHVLAAAVRGIEELSALVGDLIGAARNGKSVDAREPVALDRVVAAAVQRAHGRAPGVRFVTSLEPFTVSGSAARLERAVDNVLDNAVKWSPPGGTVEVTLAGGVLGIRDHGPGIDPDDLPHVFDRFYRAPAARGLPGSGLGLAIVKQTVEDHGGTVEAARADGGGTAVLLRF